MEGVALKGDVAEGVGGDGEACDDCLTSDHVPVGFCILRRSWQDEAFVLVCSRRVAIAVVGDSGAVGQNGRNVEIRGTAMRCSWSPRSDGVEFYMQQRWAALILGAWRAGVCKLLRQLRQYVSVQSVRPCRAARGAALGRLASPRPQRSSGPFGRGPSVSRFCIGSRLS